MIVDALKTEKTYTIEDIYALPDGENNTVEQYDFDETVPVGIYERFSINMQHFTSFM